MLFGSSRHGGLVLVCFMQAGGWAGLALDKKRMGVGRGNSSDE